MLVCVTHTLFLFVSFFVSLCVTHMLYCYSGVIIRYNGSEEIPSSSRSKKRRLLISSAFGDEEKQQILDSHNFYRNKTVCCFHYFVISGVYDKQHPLPLPLSLLPSPFFGRSEETVVRNPPPLFCWVKDGIVCLVFTCFFLYCSKNFYSPSKWWSDHSVCPKPKCCMYTQAMGDTPGHPAASNMNELLWDDSLVCVVCVCGVYMLWSVWCKQAAISQRYAKECFWRHNPSRGHQFLVQSDEKKTFKMDPNLSVGENLYVPLCGFEFVLILCNMYILKDSWHGDLLSDTISISFLYVLFTHRPFYTLIFTPKSFIVCLSHYQDGIFAWYIEYEVCVCVCVCGSVCLSFSRCVCIVSVFVILKDYQFNRIPNTCVEGRKCGHYTQCVCVLSMRVLLVCWKWYFEWQMW